MKANNNNKSFYGVILVGIILVLSTFFYYPIHFDDVLSLEVVPEFDIDISIWRIIFEPIIGLLLFFNRSLYAIQEMQFVLFWIIVIFLIISLRKYQRLDKLERAKYLKSQWVHIPILLGLWFAVFVIIIFVPLPSNKIINHSDNYILVSTHAHTEYSHDGLISQENMWQWQKDNGFDAFFITDHANHKKTYELVSRQRKGEFNMEPLIMVGEEYSASNHMSLLGLKNKFTTKGLSDQQVVDSVHAYGGIVLMNHWFDDERKTLDYYRNLGVDGFEIENSGKEKYYDRDIYNRLKAYCISHNLIMSGGLDFHGYGNASTLWNALEIPKWHKMDALTKEKAILGILRNGDQSKLKILMYKDRAYYKNENLIFRPLFTIVNYFRTLNLYQVLSWFFWIVLFTVMNKIMIRNKIGLDKINASLGLMGAAILLLLGLFYYEKIDKIKGYTEMYEEYSTLLFYSGSVFLVYMMSFIYFKFVRKDRLNMI